jgi:SPP1 gp7 family putative phage head morphogenesis protein
MIEELREARRAARVLLEMTQPNGRKFELPPKKAKLERKRLRDKIKGSKKLRPQIETAIENMHEAFLQRSGLHGFREASAGDDDAAKGRLHHQQAITAALNAMSADELAAVLQDGMAAMYDAGITSAADEIAQVVFGQSWDVAQTRALRAIDAYTLKLAAKITDREKASLKQLIRDAVEQGTSTRDLTAAIVDHFADGVHTETRTLSLDTWAETVARTETTRGYSAGVMDLYKQAQVERVQFLSSEDERVCPECDDLDGQYFPIDDAPDIPIHASCRCCYVGADDEEAS